jgi:hypothetical protein
LKQRKIWGLKSSGKQEATIAKELKVTRQNIHNTLNTANARIAQSLTEAAHLNKIEIQSLNPQKGFLSGYSPHFKTQTFVTFTAKNGIQIWYKHQGHCKECKQLQKCRSILIDEASERGFLLTEDEDKIVPSKLAEVLFSRIEGEEHQ